MIAPLTNTIPDILHTLFYREFSANRRRRKGTLIEKPLPKKYFVIIKIKKRLGGVKLLGTYLPSSPTMPTQVPHQPTLASNTYHPLPYLTFHKPTPFGTNDVTNPSPPILQVRPTSHLLALGTVDFPGYRSSARLEPPRPDHR